MFFQVKRAWSSSLKQNEWNTNKQLIKCDDNFPPEMKQLVVQSQEAWRIKLKTEAKEQRYVKLCLQYYTTVKISLHILHKRVTGNQLNTCAGV